MIDLIGLSYRLGADGTDGTIDCIHLCLEVRGRLNLASPPINPHWYSMNRRAILRELLTWCYRIEQPSYDGDVILFPQEVHTFGVLWQQGALYIDRYLQAVQWCPLHNMPPCHYFRGKDS